MKKIPLTLLTLATLSTLFCLPKTSFAMDGKTTFEILPLDEAQPRFYEVNDLDFGRHQVTETNRAIHPKEDLTIHLLDARVTSSPWNLQVKMVPLAASKQHILKNVTVKLGDGTLTGENAGGINKKTLEQNLSEDEFQTLLSSNDNSPHGRVTYTIPKEAISLTFGPGNISGKYQATNFWRFVDAK